MADERSGAPAGETTRSGEKLKAFLVSLATDPAKLGQFIKDPDSVMSSAELSSDEQALLKSGNPSAIYGLLTGQPTPAAWPVTILVVDLISESGKEGPMPSIRSPQTTFPLQQIYPQIQQIYPPPISLLQIYPQIHPIYPQIYPQIHPIYPIYPQIHPLQIGPLIHPIYPIHPLQIGPLIYPQIHPLIYPQIHPIYPQIHPLIYPQPFQFGQ